MKKRTTQLFSFREAARSSQQDGFFIAQQVATATGVSERCLHYWDKSGLVSPTHSGDGAGVYRGYSRTEVLLISIIKRMRDAGVSLQRIRKAVPALRAALRRRSRRKPRVLTHGKHAFILIGGPPGSRDGQVLVDALEGGQLVLAISVGSVRAEVEPKLSDPKWRPRGALLCGCECRE